LAEFSQADPVRQFADRWWCGDVCLTDTDDTLRDGGTSKHLAVGDGHARIGESLRLLREEGFRGWIMVDAWEIPDPYDAAAKAKRALDAAAA